MLLVTDEGSPDPTSEFALDTRGEASRRRRLRSDRGRRQTFDTVGERLGAAVQTSSNADFLGVWWTEGVSRQLSLGWLGPLRRNVGGHSTISRFFNPNRFASPVPRHDEPFGTDGCEGGRAGTVRHVYAAFKCPASFRGNRDRWRCCSQSLSHFDSHLQLPRIGELGNADIHLYCAVDHSRGITAVSHLGGLA